MYSDLAEIRAFTGTTCAFKCLNNFSMFVVRTNNFQAIKVTRHNNYYSHYKRVTLMNQWPRKDYPK